MPTPTIIPDRHKTALALIVRADINRTLIAAGRSQSTTDMQHTEAINSDWRIIQRYRRLAVSR